MKATFLVKFTDFVEWPPAALAGAADPFRICVAADPAFGSALDRMLEGENVRGHGLRRVSLQPQDDLRACHILYVASSEQEHAGRYLTAARGVPVLTVGETPDFLQQGGAIRFVQDGGRVRFDVNLRAAERAGLTVSSKLLRVARRVIDSQPK